MPGGRGQQGSQDHCYRCQSEREARCARLYQSQGRGRPDTDERKFAAAPSSNPVSMEERHESRKSLASIVRMTDLAKMRQMTATASKTGWRRDSRKSTFIPTVKKNRPSRRPLNGSTAVSIAFP